MKTAKLAERSQSAADCHTLACCTNLKDKFKISLAKYNTTRTVQRYNSKLCAALLEMHLLKLFNIINRLMVQYPAELILQGHERLLIPCHTMHS